MELLKEVQELIADKRDKGELNIKKFCAHKKHEISPQTITNIIRGKKVSDKTLVYLKSLLNSNE